MHVLLGVGGGISAYKSCDLASRLVQQGHELYTVMTPSAKDFVGPLTFRALSGHPVGISALDEPMGPLSHVRLARWAEMMIIAPLTQNLLSRLSLGLSPDMLSLVFQGYQGPVIAAPAMEPEMWASPQTKRRMADLVEGRAVEVVGPNEGRMASGLLGQGRMAEPQELMDALWRAQRPQTLRGLFVTITAGPTWEHFDPVRILTNPSTGTMGIALAKELSARGAEVHVVHGPGVPEPAWPRVRYTAVQSAREMMGEVQSAMPGADVLIGAAAVSDFRPAEPAGKKMRKSELSRTWAMEANPDIMAEMGQIYHDSKLLVGFAAETHEVVESALAKARRKHLHAIVANKVGNGEGFGAGQYFAAVLRAGETKNVLARMSKEQLAEKVADLLAEWREERGDRAHV